MFALFAAFFIGQHVDFSAFNRIQTLLMITVAIAMAGMVLGWQSELLGGLLNVGGVLAFYTIHFAARASWPPPTFPLLAVPGLLYLIAWWCHTPASTEP
jgi:hypothetical protein